MSDRKPDLSPARVVELHERLRAFLLAEMGHEWTAVITSALAYELASCVAAMAVTPAQAHRAIDDACRNSHAQIEAFGVGHPHP